MKKQREDINFTIFNALKVLSTCLDAYIYIQRFLRGQMDRCNWHNWLLYLLLRVHTWSNYLLNVKSYWNSILTHYWTNTPIIYQCFVRNHHCEETNQFIALSRCGCTFSMALSRRGCTFSMALSRRGCTFSIVLSPYVWHAFTDKARGMGLNIFVHMLSPPPPPLPTLNLFLTPMYAPQKWHNKYDLSTVPKNSFHGIRLVCGMYDWGCKYLII